MRRFAKFVAALLVALTAMPVLAVAPCRQAIHSMKCCSSECPMMATPAGAKLATRTEPEITRPAYCTTSHRTIPFAVQTVTENRSNIAALHSQSLNVFIVVKENRGLMPLPKGPPFSLSSRASLCTFLI